MKRSSSNDDGDDKGIDLRSVEFPSDTLALKAIRALDPELLDVGGRIEHVDDRYARFKLLVENKLINLMCCEREVAHTAYAKAAGLKSVTDEFGFDYAPELEKHYIECGLASGPHLARQMIRDIESQAAILGAKHSL